MQLGFVAFGSMQIVFLLSLAPAGCHGQMTFHLPNISVIHNIAHL